MLATRNNSKDFSELNQYKLLRQMQENKPDKTRKAVASGTFYLADRFELSRALEIYFNKHRAAPDRRPLRAMIVPHAGYIYSGDVATQAFVHIDPTSSSHIVFLIGQSHSATFEGASIWQEGHFSTPLGEIPICERITHKLSSNPVFDFPQQHHLNDHCLEVELPFLQFKLGENIEIVPILIGTRNQDIIHEIAAALKPWFEEEHLFVISTDLSHYPKYADAVRSDGLITDAIMKNNTEAFKHQVEVIESRGMDNLQTSLCGYGAVLCLLELTSQNDGFIFEKTAYSNSAVVSNDYSKVVGYASIVVRSETMKESRMMLSISDRKLLLDLARQSIQAGIKRESTVIPSEDSLSTHLLLSCGVFVSLHINEKLRGCMGTFSQEKSLIANVIDMAGASAFRDPRFSRLTEEELQEAIIDISVLTPMKEIQDIAEITIGKHGILIRKGSASGTFLPQVAQENQWTIEQMLGHCSRDKAGIGWDGWKDPNTRIYIYEAIVFSEKLFS